MKKTLFDISFDRLHDYLEQHAMRNTPVRTSILQQVCSLPQPFTAEQLENACAPLRISTASVYNALNLFTSARILHASKRQRGFMRIEYELITEAPTRMTYVCKRCGRTVNIQDKAIVRMIKEHRYSNFEVEHFSLCVYGVCKVCRKHVDNQNQ